MNRIPFVDLAAQYASIRTEVDAALGRVVASGAFILGPDVAAFERSFAAYCGARHAVGVASGLDALALALEARGIGAGDEVILPANTFIATACAVSRVGARPVFVDCDEESFCIDPARIARAITPRTRAIVPVHLFGQLADIAAISELARRYHFFLLEDAAQSHGARLDGRPAGSFGDAAGFSFYPAKNLGAYGDAGAVVTNDDALADKIRLLRSYGQRAKHLHEVPGGNSRLDSLQAAVLAVKLPHLDAWNEARRHAAAEYDRKLAALKSVKTPRPAADWRAHVYHLYVVRVPERDRVRERLAERGIETGIHYPTPIHLQEAYAVLGHRRGDFPVAERLADEMLSLPMFPEITSDQIDRVVESLAIALAG